MWVVFRFVIEQPSQHLLFFQKGRENLKQIVSGQFIYCFWKFPFKQLGFLSLEQDDKGFNQNCSFYLLYQYGVNDASEAQSHLAAEQREQLTFCKIFNVPVMTKAHMHPVLSVLYKCFPLHGSQLPGHFGSLHVLVSKMQQSCTKVKTMVLNNRQ